MFIKDVKEETYSMKIISTILLVVILVGCSSVQKTTENKKIDTESIVLINQGLDNLTVKGQVTFKAKETQLAGNYKTELSGTDSLALTLFGPMQIAAGKLYARKDYFLFYDVFNNKAYEGTPNAQNLKSAFQIELSFDDMIKLFKGEVPYDSEFYKFDQNLEKGKLFKYKAPGEYVDFALVDSKGSLVRYQRKLTDGSLALNVQYSDYEAQGEFLLPGKVVFSFPAYEAIVTFEADDYKINEQYQKPFLFSVPSDIKRIKY